MDPSSATLFADAWNGKVCVAHEVKEMKKQKQKTMVFVGFHKVMRINNKNVSSIVVPGSVHRKISK